LLAKLFCTGGNFPAQVRFATYLPAPGTGIIENDKAKEKALLICNLRGNCTISRFFGE